MRVARRWSPVAFVCLALACGRSESRSAASRGDAVISDAVHTSGTPGFFFLFPMVSPPRHAGTFRSGLQPVVRIEELPPGTRGTIATYTASGGPYGGRVIELGESYNVLWPTAPFALNPAYAYRIHVSVSDFELGYADVDVVRKLRELLSVDTGEYVPLLDDLILPIRFRIEPEALRCVGVVCSPMDSCHAAGACDVHSGLCTNPTRPDGTSCDDGNACTLSDTCQAGACAGASPVSCLAADACHGPGACDPATGRCSSPPLADGTACDDLDGCTRGDACVAGACVGSDLVTCAALDECHAAGTCDASTGLCSNPAAPDGAACHDGNACTLADACVGGACVGASPVACVAADQCHAAGACDPASGACSNPPVADGTACSDGNACTQGDACQGGGCVGASAVACAAPDQCHATGTCDPATGACSHPDKPDGSPCDDGNACTLGDACSAGVCTGASAVACAPLDPCHDVGVCDPASGVCSNPPKGGAGTCTGPAAAISAFIAAAAANDAPAALELFTYAARERLRSRFASEPGLLATFASSMAAAVEYQVGDGRTTYKSYFSFEGGRYPFLIYLVLDENGAWKIREL